MQTLRNLRLVRWIVSVMVASLGLLGTLPAFATAHRVDVAKARQGKFRAQMLRRAQGLPDGLTQTPDAKRRAKIAAREKAAIKPVADARPLSAREMRMALGRGPFRNAYFNGTLPWQKSLRDVNLCNGNLFKSFVDIQVGRSRGAGLILQRTYNSNDGRIGPFGVGWTHAYDIRVEESANVQAETGSAASDDADSINDVPRTDFFGGKHTYHRDADGLYSPPAYLYDEMSSDYDQELTDGPKVISDTEKGMDGTVKHYISVLTLADGSEGNERACDYIEDRHGNRTVLDYNQTVLQADGSTRKLLTSVTDPIGRALTFTWTNLGTTSAPVMRISEVDAPTDPDTGQPVYKVAYGYYTDTNDPASCYNLHTVTLDPDGLDRTTTYTYTSYTDTYYDANYTQQTGTENGLLASVADPLGHSVSYQYDRYMAPSPYNGGGTTQIWSGTVWVTRISEPGGSGGTHTWTLDDSAAPGAVASWVGGRTDYSDNEPVSHPMHIYVNFDASLRTILLTGTGYHGDTSHAYEYDADNNVVTKYGDDDYAPIWQIMTYGPHGNILTERTRYSAGWSGDMTYPHGTDYTYYNASKYFQKASVTDARGHTTTMDYFADDDAAPGDRGEVKWVRDAGYGASASPSHGKQFDYMYNQYGQKATESNMNGVVTQYTYGDAWGNLTQVVQDVGGTGHLNRTTAMTYDVMGRVEQNTDALGQARIFTFSTLGQPLTVHTPARGSSPAETVSYSYDDNGRTESVTDNRGTTTFVYEPGTDRAASVTDPVTGTTSYTYGLAGERRSVTLPGGGTWTYSYVLDAEAQGGTLPLFMGDDVQVLSSENPDDAVLAPDRITDDQGRQVDFKIDHFGAPEAVAFGKTYDQFGNLVAYGTTTYAYPHGLEYDPQSGGSFPTWRPGQRQLKSVTTVWHYQDMSTSRVWVQRLVSQHAFTYDDLGQRTAVQMTITVPGAGGAPQYVGGSPQYDNDGNAANLMTTTRMEQYAYDEVNRLKSVDYGDGQTQTYAFDAMSNRTQRVDSASGTTTYGYNAANMLLDVNGTAYANDADGNTLTGGGRTNNWDAQNRLVQSVVSGTVSAFTYGAGGLRRSSTVTPSGGSAVTTRYIYDGQAMVRESKQSGLGAWQAAATYLSGPRGVEYKRDDNSGAIHWYVYDGLGSVVGELDPNGNLTAGKKYDVYGAERTGGTGAGTTRQGYMGSLGHVTDAETGLIYMRARYYEPALGRFESEDSAGDGRNWYTYCKDNPITGRDFTGHSTLQETLESTSASSEFDSADGAAFAAKGWAKGKLREAMADWAKEFLKDFLDCDVKEVKWFEKDGGPLGRLKIRIEVNGQSSTDWDFGADFVDDPAAPHFNNWRNALPSHGNHQLIESWLPFDFS